MFDFTPLQIVASLPGLIIAMVIHEYAHARVAVAMGDFTPRLAGRLTLNPAKHIDPIGLVCLFLVHFGWAKPVMINPNNFKDPKWGDIKVSVAGPLANFVTAFLASLIFAALVSNFGQPSQGMVYVFSYLIIININFGIFNLLPIPPLDGSHILKQLLPWELARKIDDLQRYSLIIILLLMMTPILGMVIIPLQRLILGIFESVIGLIF